MNSGENKMAKATPAATDRLVIITLENERARLAASDREYERRNATSTVRLDAKTVQYRIRRHLQPELDGDISEAIPTISQVRGSLNRLEERGEIVQYRCRGWGGKSTTWMSHGEADRQSAAKKAEHDEWRAERDADVLEEQGGTIAPLQDRLEIALAQLTTHGRATISPSKLESLVESLEKLLPN